MMSIPPSRPPENARPIFGVKIGSGHNAQRWEREEIFFSGDDYYHAALKAMGNARQEILIEVFTFEFDGVGQVFLESLKKARERGVTVRLLVDGIGSYLSLDRLREYCQKAQIEFRIYHPVLNVFSSEFILRPRHWRRLSHLVRRMNKRDHRKVILIDETSAFLGSINIANVHSARISGATAWKDTGIFVQGENLTILRRAVLETWRRSRYLFSINRFMFKRTAVRNSPTSLIRLNSKTRWRFLLLRDLTQRMRASERRILIANAYFIPRKAVLRGILQAARRGVYVGICVPARSDMFIAEAATRSLYGRLLRAGVHLFEYAPSMMHSKTLVIDDWSTIGSHNLNHRSLHHDLEVEAVVTHPENIERLVQDWDHLIRNAHAISIQDLGKRTLFIRIFSRVMYWFKYWI